MFICAVHGNTIKFFGIIGISILTLALLIAFIPKGEAASPSQPSANVVTPTTPSTAPVNPSDGAEASKSVSFEKIKTNEDRIALIKTYGWEIEETPAEEAKVTIPAEFDRVMESYNQIQRQQGFDLSKYRNRDMMRYTYRITNYPDYDGTVYCNLLIYKNRVVAADICSSDVNGFIAGLTGTSGGGGGQ